MPASAEHSHRLCGLEKALNKEDQNAVSQSINKILMMQALSFFIGGMPMLFYGDELGYTNDYSYLEDPGKSLRQPLDAPSRYGLG